MRGLLAWGFAVGLLGFVPACKQQLGDRCQINDDCADGLYCELSGNTPATGGTCKEINPAIADLTIIPGPDMAQPEDMSTRDH
jgi:hypothetical protein